MTTWLKQSLHSYAARHQHQTRKVETHQQDIRRCQTRQNSAPFLGQAGVESHFGKIGTATNVGSCEASTNFGNLARKHLKPLQANKNVVINQKIL